MLITDPPATAGGTDRIQVQFLMLETKSSLRLDLHATFVEPREGEEHRADQGDDQLLQPNRGPSTSLQKRVSDDLDVVATPNQMRQPSYRSRYVLDRIKQPRQQEDKQETTQCHRLNRCPLIRNRRADHRAKRRNTERIKNRRDYEPRWITRETQTEISEKQHKHHRRFTKRHH